MALPRRLELLGRLVASLRDAGVDWAWQGPFGAHVHWLSDPEAAGLDIWWRPGVGPSAPDVAALVARLCRELPAVTVVDSDDAGLPGRTSLVVRADTGPTTITLTHGDLRVGPITLVPAERVTSTASPVPRLTGSAATADLLIRPLLQGRMPEPDRIEEAREAWAATTAAERLLATDFWHSGLGEALVCELAQILDGATPTASTVTRARRRLLRAASTPGA